MNFKGVIDVKAFFDTTPSVNVERNSVLGSVALDTHLSVQPHFALTLLGQIHQNATVIEIVVAFSAAMSSGDVGS